MKDTVTLLLPGDLSEAELTEIMGEIKGMDEIDEAGSSTTRSIELATLMVWIGFAADALGTAAAAADLFKKIFGKLKSRGVTNAQVELPNGVKINLESASIEDIKDIVSSWQAEEATG